MIWGCTQIEDIRDLKAWLWLTCPPGVTMRLHLLINIRLLLQRFLLGESENSRLVRDEAGLSMVVEVLLSQSRWHKLARLLTRRASYYRKQTVLQNVRFELIPAGL